MAGCVQTACFWRCKVAIRALLASFSASWEPTAESIRIYQTVSEPVFSETESGAKQSPRPTTNGSATLQRSTPFLCLLLCHPLLLDDLAARRAGAAVLPCALGSAASLADGSPSRAHALSARPGEAALGCAVVAGD